MRANQHPASGEAAPSLPAVRSARISRETAKPQRYRRPDQTRRALIEAAARIFNSVGYHATDSNRIAREAGYAPGTFYVHFEDKLAIFLQVYEKWVSEEWAAVETILKSSAGRRATAMALSRAVLEHHRKWRTFRKSLRALTATDERVHAARVASRARQIETMSRLSRARKARMPTRGQMLAQLLIAEALCDAVADGDAKSLGIAERELVRILEQRSSELL